MHPTNLLVYINFDLILLILSLLNAYLIPPDDKNQKSHYKKTKILFPFLYMFAMIETILPALSTLIFLYKYLEEMSVALSSSKTN